MHYVESGFLALMVVWTLGSVAFALPIPRLRWRLSRVNAGLWFANWTMFGTTKEPTINVAIYTLEYRDRAPFAKAGNWVVVASGRPWTWRAGVWQPERRLADRIHRIGQDMAMAAERTPPITAVAAQRRSMLESYLEAIKPRSLEIARDIRITMRRSIYERASDVRFASHREWQVEQRIIAMFSTDDHAGER